MMDWQTIQAEVLQKQEMQSLKAFIKKERETKKILPGPADVMNAFKLTPFDKVRVVILGQDPYPGADHAHGLAFSSLSKTTPGSLKNIFSEIHRSIYAGQGKSVSECFKSNNLTKWAEQGVLLINTVLTVEEGKPGSHQGKGWELFTEHILNSLNKVSRPLIFLLWGNQARQWKRVLTAPQHHVFETSHPSPMSVNAGFDGCNHFFAVNQIIREDYLDLRMLINKEKLIPVLMEKGRQNNVTFDPELIITMNLGMFIPDIKVQTQIDWTT